MADRYHFVATGLTGGVSGQDLDAFSYSIINDGDVAYVFYNGRFYTFEYDSSSSDTEQTTTHPYIIKPDDNTGNGRWLEKTCNVLNSDIDHDQLTNTHNLTTDIDHDQLTNFVANEHIDWTNASSALKTSSTGTFNHIILPEGITTPSSLTGYSKFFIDSTDKELRRIDEDGNVTKILEGEYTSRTINFDNTMSTSEIQAAIDAVGRFIPPGVAITFQFADGTYTLSSALSFQGFYGGGNIYIQGNTSETDATTLHTSQQVFLDFSGGSNHGLFLLGNKVNNIYIYNLKIKIADVSKYCIYSIRTSAVYMYYNYLVGSGTTNINSGVMVESGYLYINRTYVDNIRYGIYSTTMSKIFSYTNDDTGVSPVYGLSAWNGGVIAKGGTQPSGSTANEFTSNGGVIR